MADKGIVARMRTILRQPHIQPPIQHLQHHDVPCRRRWRRQRVGRFAYRVGALPLKQSRFAGEQALALALLLLRRRDGLYRVAGSTVTDRNPPLARRMRDAYQPRWQRRHQRTDRLRFRTTQPTECVVQGEADVEHDFGEEGLGVGAGVDLRGWGCGGWHGLDSGCRLFWDSPSLWGWCDRG